MVDKKMGEEASGLDFIFLSTIFLLMSSDRLSLMKRDCDERPRGRASLVDSAEIFSPGKETKRE